MLDYNCSWYGKSFVKIDRFFPSSKTCSYCGHKEDTMPLDIRDWTCPECGSIHDRDINAAKNILNKGFADLCGQPIEFARVL
jgi:putative transposase